MRIKNQFGVSILETLVALGIMSVITFAMLAIFDSQNKTINGLEFKVKKNELHAAILSQFLNDSNNCGCLFNNANAFPVAGAKKLVMNNPPAAIGPFKFTSPGNCNTATIINPLINKTGLDGLILSGLEITDIQNTGSSYVGKMNLQIKSQKAVSGPQELKLEIPLDIQTTPVNASRVKIAGCSIGKRNEASEETADSQRKPIVPHSCQILYGPKSGDDNRVHSVQCPANMAATKLAIYSSGYLDGNIQLTCCKIEDYAWQGANLVRGDNFPVSHDNQNHKAYCEANEFVTGIRIQATNALDGNMTVSCNKYSGLNLTSATYGDGTIEGHTIYTEDRTFHNADCKSGLLQGIQVWAHAHFDSISQIKCGNY